MSLYIAILHNVFLLYYVDIFVSVYKIDRDSFWLGEVSVSVCVRMKKIPAFVMDLMVSLLTMHFRLQFTNKCICGHAKKLDV